MVLRSVLGSALSVVNEETLSEEQRRRLDELGFVWDVPEAAWEEGFSYLTIYRKREGHCRVPATYRENGYSLGPWVRTQRRNKETMSFEHRKRLDEIGFVWEPLEADWEEGFNYLTTYREREGHCRVPQGYKENAYSLGQWATMQRVKRRTLSDARKQRLDQLGFVWNPSEEAWDKGYGYLTAYKAREGHCRVPADHTEDGYRLGKWVTVQRTNKRLSLARQKATGRTWFCVESAVKNCVLMVGGLHQSFSRTGPPFLMPFSGRPAGNRTVVVKECCW